MPDPAASPSRELFEFRGWNEPALLDREVARRTVRTASLLVAVAAAMFAAIYWFADSPFLSVPTLVTSVALVVIAFAPFRSAHAQLATAMSAGLLLLGSQEFLLGDVNTGVTVWFLVPNLAAMILGARRLAAGGAVFTVTVIVTVALARLFGWPIIGNEPLPQPDLVMAVSALGSLVLIGVIARITLGARRQLMSEVNSRNEALADALEEAEAARAVAIGAAEAKDRFFANLTHEIRTPLNGIAGTTELLRHTALSADQRPLVDALTASNENLVALVNAMLDHARLRAGHVTLDLAPMDIRRAARDLADLFAAQAADRGLAFVVRVEDDVPTWLETDAIRVRQIVGNLVANAIKFTDSGSVTAIATLVPADGAHLDPRLVVTVSDTGAGIPPEQARSIFEPFIQGDASISRTHGGTGLGLAIATQLTELMGGTLAVRSRLGVGSVFTLAVPVLPALAPPDAAAPTGADAAPARPGDARAIRVLLAEDNEINRLVASRMLSRIGAHATVAGNGIEAVTLATAEDFRLILMDLQMPGMDGIEAARAIRLAEAARGAAAVPIIAMTGNDPGDYGDECEAAGMNGFLMKPVGLVELRALLDRIAPDPPEVESKRPGASRAAFERSDEVRRSPAATDHG
jgi:signal transduction histidine kinase/CheY-like chemotaxis protein